MASDTSASTTVGPVHIRPLATEELCLAYRLILQQGWSMSLERYTDIHTYKPDAILGAYTENGLLIGSIIAIDLFGAQAYIAGFVIHPNFRRKGVGRCLMEYVTTHLQGSNIILDSVMNALEFYTKFGFQNSLMILREVEIHVMADSQVHSLVDLDIAKVTTRNMQSVMQYDQSVCHFDRSDHMPVWLLSESSISFGSFHKGKCVGYVCVTFLSDLQKYVAQPLYADSPDIALHLLKAVLQKVSIPCMLVLTVVNDLMSKASKMCHSLGEVTRSSLFLQRMHTKEDTTHGFALDKIYSVNLGGNTFL